jgi:uncharacterized protein YfaQ (DUF2300 family)
MIERLIVEPDDRNRHGRRPADSRIGHHGPTSRTDLKARLGGSAHWQASQSGLWLRCATPQPGLKI